MGKLTTSRKVLAFATEIQLVAMTKSPHPRAEAIVQKAVTQLRREFGMSRDLKKAEIVAFMRKDECGQSVSAADLQDRFGWDIDLIRELLKEMTEGISPKIEIFKQQTISTGPRGGRPAVRYRLII